MVLSPLLVPVGRWCMRIKRPEWKAPQGTVCGRCDAARAPTTAAPASRNWYRWLLTSAPPASACSPLVAALLFGAVGARLWFLQTVQAESLQQTVDARKTKTVPLVPERGRIFDADGRILADNERVLDGRRRLGRDPPRHRSGRAVHAACRAGWRCRSRRWRPATTPSVYSRYLPMPLEGGRHEESWPSPSTSGSRTSPAYDREGLAAGLPLRPAGQPRPRLHGRDHRRGRASTTRSLGYDTSVDGEQVGRSGVELSMEETLHGKWGEAVYEVDADNRIVREISYEAPVNGMDVQLSIDLDLQQYAERLLQTQLRLQARVHRAATRRSTDPPDGTEAAPLDRDLNGGAEVPYKAPAGSVIVMNHQTGQIAAMASYPTFDNRWFYAGVDSEKFDQIFPPPTPEGEPPLDPDQSALTNRAIQGQYNMGSSFKPFTAYAALATGRLGPGIDVQRPGHVQAGVDRPTTCAPAGVRCVFRNSTCPPTGQPCVYGTVERDDGARRVERHVLLQARRGVLQHAAARSCRTTSAVRLRRRHRHRPAVRVRRPGADRTS